MRTLFVLAFVALAITNEVFADGKVGPIWNATQSTGTFANNFLKAVAHNNLKNLITSPFSAQVALAMLAYGAGGSTAETLRSVLTLPADDQLGQDGLKALFETFNVTHGVELRLANNLFTSKTIQVKNSYKRLIATVFSSSIQELDFRDGEAAARAINTWCEQQTHRRIKNLFQPDALDPTTILVLVNAIYFKGKWQARFNSSLTREMPFHVDAHTTKNVSTMYMKNKFRYGYVPELDSDIIELPYKGQKLSMIIVLPKATDGLSRIVDNINHLNLTEYLHYTYSTKVELYLPKFEIKTKLDLKKTLVQLGLREIFHDSANFSGIANVTSKVSKAVQKAFIKVNEEGTEAAAATGFGVMLLSSRQPDPLIFKVDHPAYFAIRHSETGTILFNGFLTDP